MSKTTRSQGADTRWSLPLVWVWIGIMMTGLSPVFIIATSDGGRDTPLTRTFGFTLLVGLLLIVATIWSNWRPGAIEIDAQDLRK